MISVLEESTIRLLLTKYGDETDDSIVLPRCPPIIVYWGVLTPTGDTFFVQPDRSRTIEKMIKEHFRLSIYFNP